MLRLLRHRLRGHPTEIGRHLALSAQKAGEVVTLSVGFENSQGQRFSVDGTPAEWQELLDRMMQMVRTHRGRLVQNELNRRS